MSDPDFASSSRTSVLRGVALLGTGRPAGLRQFGGSSQSFLASLAPLIAFPAVFAVLEAAQGNNEAALRRLLGSACVLLSPPVLSHAVARFWGRDAAWLRFATAFNWCQWAIPAAASLLFLAIDAWMALGLPRDPAASFILYGLMAYALWLHWFLMRHGLQLSALRAAAGTAFVNLGTGLLFVGPGLIRLWLSEAEGPRP
ncbi:MAG: hypothetical protein JOZ42_16525 [Acetobacteraceae bacterium]|nr:hypothetical protein [Acetobacteraceae bacterium]